MLFVGGIECFAAGWVYKIEDQIEILGANIVIAYITTTFGSVTLACILWFGLSNADVALWAGFVGLVVSYIIGMLFIFCLMRKKKQADPSLTWKGMYYDLLIRNVMDLRSDLSEVVGRMPIVWAFLIKHFIPPIILILFALGADANMKDASGNEVKVFGNYGGYVTSPYQVLGILIMVFVGFLFISSLVFPKMYAALQPPTDPENNIKFQTSSVDEPEKVVAYPEDDPKETSAKGEDGFEEDEVVVEPAPEEHVA